VGVQTDGHGEINIYIFETVRHEGTKKKNNTVTLAK